MQSVPWLAQELSPDRQRINAWRVRGMSSLVTAPTAEPVDLAFFKTHGRIDTAADDAVTTFRLKAARRWAERYTGRAFMQQTWSWTLLDGDITQVVPILLPVVPVISVSSVTSYNGAGTPTVMSSAGYFLDAVSTPARLLLTEGSVWPSGLRQFNSLVVQYVAGYGTDPNLVPEEIRQAILLLASEWYERVEATTDLGLAEIPFGIRALLDPYRVAA
jgi:uncharacterized phiE125 gp8 family phage protein